MTSFNDWVAQQIAGQAAAVDATPILKIVEKIESINSDLAQFWGDVSGWAPVCAADLLGKSRLDWQVSLSRSLKHWITDPPDAIDAGDLILGWVNLGSLIEGTIKLFLSVHYSDYQHDLENLKKTQAYHAKKGKLLSPDGLRLDVLIDYCKVAALLPKDELELCRQVQERRNAVHAFQDRPIGTGTELHAAIRAYFLMLKSNAARLPYPDDNFAPRELQRRRTYVASIMVPNTKS